MPDFTASSLPTDAPTADGLLRAVLDVSLTAINLLHPLYAAEGGKLVDFALDYLNPAAQRLTGLPEQPGGTMQSHFPDTFTNGVFDFYKRVFATGEAGNYNFNYQADGFDNHFEIAARRHGEQLVIGFTTTTGGTRAGVITTLRESQAREQAAREQAARAEAEHQRNELARVFEQAPLAIAVYRGPNYIIELANPTVCRLWGRTQKQIVGKGLFEALPEMAGMGFEELLNEVMATGVPYVAYAMEAQHDRNSHRETVYWDFVYEPMREADGRITGVMVVANEVSAQVLARQQMQQLNDELEIRVTARSAEVRAALHEAEQQREQARVQQALLGQILGQVPAAIATLSGPEHRYSFFNAPYQALVAGRGMLGHTVAELLPEVVEQGFVDLLDRVYHTGQPFIGTETLLMLRDQTTRQPEQRYIDFMYQPLVDGQQQPQGILAFILDVTDRVRARKQAATLQAAMMGVLKRQAQARQDLFQIFEQTPAAIVLLREPDHRIDYFNPAFAELFPPEEWAGPLQGHTITEVYPRVKVAGLMKLLNKVFRTGVSEMVTEMPLAELQPGSPRYVTFSYQAYREQSNIVGVAALVYDVTEQVLTRRQTEALQAELLASARQQLQERESFYEIFDQTPALIQFLREPNHRIEYVNAAYQHLFAGRQLVGLNIADAVPELQEQGFVALLNQVYQTGETHFSIEQPFNVTTIAGQPASLAYFTFVYQAYRQNGQVAGISLFGFEVTEQVQARKQVQAFSEEMQAANAALHNTNNRLARTNSDLDTFVYTASHDLKAPISNIEGLLLALRHELPTAIVQQDMITRLLDLMQGSVERFQQTIGHLTDISQLQQPEAPETVDLATLIRGVQLDLAPLIEAAAATLTVLLTGCETVRVAPKNLRSVVYNLLSNAVKYRAPDRPAEVQLRTHCTSQNVVLEVQDNGLGLSETQQGQLFGMFRRLHTHVEGSGVGLFMVKRLIENAGGTIAVRSQVGEGTTFTVILPA